MKCVNCGKYIMGTDKYFMLNVSRVDKSTNNIAVCEECSETVTPMELYMKGVIPMNNSDDDVVEADATVLDEVDAYVDKLEADYAAAEKINDGYDDFPPEEVKRAIRECDTMEEFAARCPGYEEYYEAEVEGK